MNIEKLNKSVELFKNTFMHVSFTDLIILI